MNNKLKRDWMSWLVFVPNLLFGLIYLKDYLIYQTMTKNFEDLSQFRPTPMAILVLPILAMVFYQLAKSRPAAIIKRINYFLQPFFTVMALLYVAVFLFKGISYWVVPLIGAIVFLHNLQSGLSKGGEKMNAYVEGSAIVDDKIDEVEAGQGDFVIGEIYKPNRDETGRVPDGEDDYVPSAKKAVLPIHDRFVHCLVLGVKCGPVHL